MNQLTASLFAFGIWAACCASSNGRAHADDFILKGKVTAKAPESSPVTIDAVIAFLGDFAVAAPLSDDSKASLDFKNGTVFDLKRNAWRHNENKAWVDMEACRQWEKASLKKSEESLAVAQSDDFRSFFEALIKPDFKTAEHGNGDLVISNSRLKYEITPAEKITPSQLDAFLTYDRLNAFHKAMTEPGLPPTPQLAVDDILKKRSVFPKKTTATISSPRGDIKFTNEVTIEPITPEVAAEVKEAIDAASPQQ